MKKIIICGALLFGAFTFAQNSKEAKIRELLVLTKTDKLAMMGVKQMLDSYAQTGKVSREMLAGFEKEIKSEDLINMYVPVYSKHYTEQDVDGLLTFYKSPVGQKMVAVSPEIMKDSMEAGREWGQKIALRFVEKMNAEKGLQNPPMPAK